MKSLITFIFLPSLIFSFSVNSQMLSQSFSISQFTNSVIVEVEGIVEFEYWDKEEILVESTIKSTTDIKSDYALRYAVRKGHFDLVASLDANANVLLIKPKKNNTTIYQQGQKQKTKTTFKIFIPKRLHYKIN